MQFLGMNTIKMALILSLGTSFPTHGETYELEKIQQAFWRARKNPLEFKEI